ncbi:MAG: N-acetylmuramoyl-L-alanine amidase, partial [Bacillota bacterium]|nr:N-acetylmuramoyl-L-alanine amidase [Bacillota bacterium]
GGGVGVEVVVSGLGGKAEEVAKRVAANISNELGIPNRGVKVMNLIVLNKTTCPAILVECCFVDSSDADKYNADKIAKAIAEGILNTSLNTVQPTVTPIVNQVISNGGDYMSKPYHNGSTPEPVYSEEALINKIGSLDPYETCEAIADVNNKIVVLYNTAHGKKVGVVAYRGGL